MIETIIAYVILFAPSLLSIFGIVLGVIKNVSNSKATTTAIAAIKDEALTTFNVIKDSKELADIYKLLKDVVSENIALKKQLTECTEALTCIRKNNPELFTKKE